MVSSSSPLSSHTLPWTFYSLLEARECLPEAQIGIVVTVGYEHANIKKRLKGNYESLLAMLVANIKRYSTTIILDIY